VDGAQRVSLTEAVSAVRKELAEAMAQGAGEPLRFRLGPVELEFEIVLLVTGEGKAEVRAWVVAGDAGGAASRSVTHRLRVSLNPVEDSGSSLDVGGGIEDWDRPSL